jgi:hypothetical protein
VLSNESPSRPPGAERAELQTQQIGLIPPAPNDGRVFLMRRSMAQTTHGLIGGGRAKPIARERQAIGGDLTEAAAARELLDPEHLDGRQSVREQVEVVYPQHLARSGVMSGPVDQRQQQGVRIADRECRCAKGRNRNAALPQLVKGEAVGERLHVRDFPVHVDGVQQTAPICFEMVALVRHEPPGGLGWTDVPEAAERILRDSHVLGRDEQVGVRPEAKVRRRVVRVSQRGALERQRAHARRRQVRQGSHHL